MSIHLIFDLFAAALAMTMTVVVYHWRLRDQAEATLGVAGASYAAALVLGAGLGGYGFGTLNLVLSGQPGLGRSMLGALAGAVLTVELYKWARGIKSSTGIVFVVGFATSIAVGRIGCFLSGLGDQTYGVETVLPWGYDFGDGATRHPVQLYEAIAMAAFLGGALLALARRSVFFLAHGFYLCAGYYAAQRFVWEFLKPYATVAGPLNLFHILALALMAYAIFMTMRSRDATA